MNLKKAKEIAQLYQELLENVSKQEANSEEEPSRTEALCHVRSMLDKMEEFLTIVERHTTYDPPSWDKFNRGLGFVQGVFWMVGVYSLNELREHNQT